MVNNKFAATCGNLDFDADLFKIEDGCIVIRTDAIKTTGTYVLKATRAEDGKITYAWVKEVTAQ